MPRVRQALEGIALKKEKKFYSKEVRQANQQLPKVGYAVNISGQNDNDDYNSYKKKPYWLEYRPQDAKAKDGNRKFYILQAIIPNDNASYTVYYLPTYFKSNGFYFYSGVNHDGFQEIRQLISPNNNFKDDDGIFTLWFDFVEKMSAFVTFSVTYLDSDGKTISVQPLGTGPRCFCVYRSFDLQNTNIHANNSVTNINTRMYFAPGYIRIATMTNDSGYSDEINNLLLGTANYNQKYGGGYEVELDSNELQRLDIMKFEIIYN